MTAQQIARARAIFNEFANPFDEFHYDVEGDRLEMTLRGFGFVIEADGSTTLKYPRPGIEVRSEYRYDIREMMIRDDLTYDEARDLLAGFADGRE